MCLLQTLKNLNSTLVEGLHLTHTSPYSTLATWLHRWSVSWSCVLNFIRDIWKYQTYYCTLLLPPLLLPHQPTPSFLFTYGFIFFSSENPYIKLLGWRCRVASQLHLLSAFKGSERGREREKKICVCSMALRWLTNKMAFFLIHTTHILMVSAWERVRWHNVTKLGRGAARIIFRTQWPDWPTFQQAKRPN